MLRLQLGVQVRYIGVERFGIKILASSVKRSFYGNKIFVNGGKFFSNVAIENNSIPKFDAPFAKSITVNAFYLAKGIDLRRIQTLFPVANILQSNKEFFTVILPEINDHAPHMSGVSLQASSISNNANNAIESGPSSKGMKSSFSDLPVQSEGSFVSRGLAQNIDETLNTSRSYVAFYTYGSVVFTNCSDLQISSTIHSIQDYCTAYFGPKTSPNRPVVLKSSSSVMTEDLQIKIHPELENWSLFKANELFLKELDLKNLIVVSFVLAQSTALNYYERAIVDLLERFQKSESQPIPAMSPDIEYRTNSHRANMVAQLMRESNTALYEIITKLGLLDRTKLRDSVWTYEKYSDIFDSLRDEFELQSRWETLCTKTDMLKSNMEFFLDVVNVEKGLRLERIIIALISIEIMISLTEIGINHFF